MLTKGFKDEDQERVGAQLGDIFAIEFTPDYWERQQRQDLNIRLKALIHLSIDDIEKLNGRELLEHLGNLNLSFSNFEKIGDIIWKIIPLEPEGMEQNLAEKVVAIYEYAQQQTKMFSFGLIGKITEAKSLLTKE